MGIHRPFHFEGGDVLAVVADKVLEPAEVDVITVGVALQAVTGVVPTTGKSVGGGLRLLVVPWAAERR